MLNRDAILASTANLRTATVQAFGGEVQIRELNAKDMADLAMAMKTNESEAMVLWVIASVINGDGGPVFTAADKELVGKLSASDILKVGNAAVELNGLSRPNEISKNS